MKKPISFYQSYDLDSAKDSREENGETKTFALRQAESEVAEVHHRDTETLEGTGTLSFVDLSQKEQNKQSPSKSPFPRKALFDTRNGFKSVIKWEGRVDEIFQKEGVFSATLIDLKKGGTKETTQLPLVEVSDHDKLFLKPGAIFYWNIGYEKQNGQVKKVSLIRFRRLPEELQEEEWNNILDKANKLERALNWE